MSETSGHSPRSSSLSSRRASLLSRRSCRSISALMRCDSFSSADRQQQPAMVRAAAHGETRPARARTLHPAARVRREKIRADFSLGERAPGLRGSVPP